MAESENHTTQQGLCYLITEQDVHAYIDGELAPGRRAAVERFMAERTMTANQAVAHLRSMFDLRAVRDHLYQDRDLKAEIERLLAKRAAKSARDGAAPAEQVSA